MFPPDLFNTWSILYAWDIGYKLKWWQKISASLISASFRSIIMSLKITEVQVKRIVHLATKFCSDPMRPRHYSISFHASFWKLLVTISRYGKHALFRASHWHDHLCTCLHQFYWNFSQQFMCIGSIQFNDWSRTNQVEFKVSVRFFLWISH